MVGIAITMETPRIANKALVVDNGHEALEGSA